MKLQLIRLRRLLLANILLLLAYVIYNEVYVRFFPQPVQAICQVVAVDEEKNVFGVNCLKR